MNPLTYCGWIAIRNHRDLGPEKEFFDTQTLAHSVEAVKDRVRWFTYKAPYPVVRIAQVIVTEVS